MYVVNCATSLCELSESENNVRDWRPGGETRPACLPLLTLGHACTVYRVKFQLRGKYFARDMYAVLHIVFCEIVSPHMKYKAYTMNV